MAFAISQINKSEFLAALSRYPQYVPASLQDLDTLRYETIPSELAQRRKDDTAKLSLTLAEVEKLVEWKLKHGTFRPTLLALVRKNSPEDIASTTATAFRQLLPASESENPTRNTLPALKTLIALKGIGPATASLLLSCADPAHTPFFSDELFRWTHWSDPEVKGKGAGWGRKIGYTEKEYGALVERVEDLVKRTSEWGDASERGWAALEVEKVAYVLGKEDVDVGGEGEERKKRAAAEVEEPGKETKRVKKGEDRETSGDAPTKKQKGRPRKAAADAKKSPGGETPKRATRSSARKKA